MKGFKSNIEKDALKNTNFRKVLYTSKHLQTLINTGTAEQLKMYTIYAPPNHKDGIINPTKKDAEINDVEFDGKTTE
jgi:hypothetical protein